MKKLIVFLLFFVFSFIYTQAQSKVQFQSLNDPVPFDQSIKRGKLENGIQYYIKQNKKPEKRAELRLVIKAGSILEDEDQKGLAHFVEHMLFNGTESFPKNELISFLEKTGIRFGADLNASTGFDRTLYMLTLPTDDKKLLEQGVQVLEEWAHKATFAPEEIDKERGVILEEWRLGKGAMDRIQKQQLPKILYNSRYAERLPIGDTAVILNAPYEAFTRYYRDWYRPDLMGVIAVGDFDIAEMEQLIKKYFNRLKPHPNPKPRIYYDLPKHDEVIVSINTDKELPFSQITMYYKHPPSTEGTFGAYRESIKNSLIQTMLNQRFAEIRRKKDPPFLFAMSFQINNALGRSSIFALVAQVKSDKFQPGFDALTTEAFRVIQHGFTQSELERAKSEYIRNMESAFNEKDKTESYLFAEELARHFEFGESVPGIEYELELAKLFAPEITLDEINKQATSLIKDGSLVITMSGPEKPDVIMPTEKDVLNLYATISKKSLEPYTDEVATTPLFEKEVKPGTIKNETKIKDIDVTQWTLSNGAKVYLKPTDFKNDEILFRAVAPGGHSIADDKLYVSAWNSSGIVSESGIANFNKTQLEKFLTGKIVGVTPSISEMYNYLYGSAAPADFEILLQLAHLYFTDPRLDYEAAQIYIDRLKESVKLSKLSPDNAFRDTFNVTLHNYHPRRMPLTDEMINKLDPDEAFDFFKERFADASNYAFFFVGNFKIDEIKPLILKYLGSLPSHNKQETWRDIGVKLATGNITKVVRKGIEKKSSVRIAITGDFDFKPQNRFELRSLIEVFNIILRERIREDKGGVYGIYAYPTINKYPKSNYIITIGFGCDPDRVDELTSEVREIIKDLKAKPPKDDYIEKVKEIQKREHEVNIKNNNWWLNNLVSYYTNGEDMKDIPKFVKYFDKLKAKDIQQYAKKYFTDNYLQVVLLPEDTQ